MSNRDSKPDVGPAEQASPRETKPSSSPGRGSTAAKALLPLAVVIAGGALVYTLTTPDAGAPPESPSAQPAQDCTAMLEILRHSLGRYELAAARQAVAQAPLTCRESPQWRGSEAELLVLEGQVAAGKKLADSALKKEPKLLSARRVACLALLQAEENEQSRVCFAPLLAEAPKDLATVFEAARAAQHANNYRGAREGFLKTLRLDPQHVEARFRLVQLTEAIGAKPEAANHLKKLEQIARVDDPRLAQARQLLAPSKSPKPSSSTVASP